MTLLWQVLTVAATAAFARGEPEGKLPVTRITTKTYYAPAKVAYGSFQSFGTSYGSPSLPLSPTVQSFSGSYVEAGEPYPRHEAYHNEGHLPDANYPQSEENVPPVGENFLRLNHHHHHENHFQSHDGHNFHHQLPPQEQTFHEQEPSFPPPSFPSPQNEAQDRQDAPQSRPTPSPTPTPPPTPQPQPQPRGRQNPPQQRPTPPPPARPSPPPGRQNALPVAPVANDRRQGVPATPQVSFRTPTSNLEEILEQEWNAFKATFNKTYPSFEEERQRREIFIENRNKVARFNQEYGNGRHSFVQKLNQYADLLNHEFNQQVNGLNRTRRDGTPPPERRPSSFISSANVQLPSYVDWREAGAVTPVRSQGSCGACYAFAAAGALEGQVYRKTGRLTELSPQNLIDCTQSYTNNGCTGGLMEYAFEYIKDNRGIDTETSYPFEARDGEECRYREDGYGAHATGYIIIDEGDEGALEMAVGTIGPVAIGIDAHADSFQFYSNGIYFEPLCSSDLNDINHAVLVVGYGTEPSGQQYWLVKNSYGPEWGIGGYMKVAKNSNNHCAIASYATYPLV